MLTTTSILVPARNEGHHIGRLIDDLRRQSAFTATDQLYIIDDHSTDDTVRTAHSFPDEIVKVLHLKDYPKAQSIKAHKKAALTYAISESTGPLIVTTDADCRWTPGVLSEIKAAHALGYNFISGPVLIDQANDYCSGFQALDMAAYMFLTAAYDARRQPLLANGAHLSFSRQLFAQINGYEGVDHLPSGDDVLLLQKALNQGKARVRFLVSSEAVVTTAAVKGWSAFWAQRVRWAGKTKAYTQSSLKGVQAFNFLVALTLIMGCLMGLLFSKALLVGSLIAWGIKAGVDYYLLRTVCHHFQRKAWLRYYPFSMFFQPCYLLAVGTAALLGLSTSWKGRPA